MMNGKLRRGWVVEYCAGAVDAIPLDPPLEASREPAHNRGDVIVTGRKKERRNDRSKTSRDSFATMKRPGKMPGHVANSDGDSGFEQNPHPLGNRLVENVIVNRVQQV